MGTHPFFTPDEFSARVARLAPAHARRRSGRRTVRRNRGDGLADRLRQFGKPLALRRHSAGGRAVLPDPRLGRGAVPAAKLDRRRAHISRLGRPNAGAARLRWRSAGWHRRGSGSTTTPTACRWHASPVSRTALPGARFVDLGNVIWRLRLIKSPAEIALLRQCAGIADEALRRAAAVCVPGVSQREAARAAVNAFVELGADPGPPGPITAGRGWDFLHGHLEDTPLTHRRHRTHRTDPTHRRL